MRYKTQKRREQDEILYGVYEELWNTRLHRSELSFEPLPFLFNKAMFFVFAHVLPRGAYPGFATYKKNIVFLTLKEHQQFDQGIISDDPRFFWLIELRELLKQEYYRASQTGKFFHNNN